MYLRIRVSIFSAARAALGIYKHEERHYVSRIWMYICIRERPCVYNDARRTDANEQYGFLSIADRESEREREMPSFSSGNNASFALAVINVKRANRDTSKLLRRNEIKR